ncbi:podocalyxin-like protein 2 isoform X2 [Dipodomys merriami]|uniref:podocalyxin-like protein 2 isoform X2 n=1 Tax=Dipodomys merriami TaxID=94247 RepID=UPI003855C212
MARPPRAARPPPPPPLLLLLLAAGVSLGACAPGTDEPSPEGLTSTSLLDLLLPTGLGPLEPEEPSEAPGSGLPSEDSEESRILQPPQYFWEEEETLNGSALDLGPTADYIFPDLTGKAASLEDPDLPSALPKMSLAEPPWHLPLQEEEEEEEEREKEEVEKEEEEEEEEEEELLPVSRSQEEAPTLATSPSTTGRSQEDPGDQAVSQAEMESTVQPSLAPPSATPSAASPEGPDITGREAGPGAELQAAQEAGAGATPGTAGTGTWPPPAGGGAAPPTEGPRYPGTPASFPPTPQDSDPAPSSAAPRQGDPSRQPWDSAQVICKDWSNLAGKSYVILNMTENVDCEAFRRRRGLRLLALVEEALPGRGRGAWRISLSKPSEKEQHLLMTLVGEQGVVPTQDVLSVLSSIRRSLEEELGPLTPDWNPELLHHQQLPGAGHPGAQRLRDAVRGAGGHRRRLLPHHRAGPALQLLAAPAAQA